MITCKSNQKRKQNIENYNPISKKICTQNIKISSLQELLQFLYVLNFFPKELNKIICYYSCTSMTYFSREIDFKTPWSETSSFAFHDNKIFCFSHTYCTMKIYDLDGNLLLDNQLNISNERTIETSSSLIINDEIYINNFGSLLIFNKVGDLISSLKNETKRYRNVYMTKFNNEIFINDSQQIKVIDKNGNILRYINCFLENEKYVEMKGIEIYNNNIYIIDEFNRCIKIFDIDGNFADDKPLKCCDSKFISPHDLTFLNNQLYILCGNHICIYENDLKFIKKLDISHREAHPSRLGRSQNELYIIYRQYNRILVYRNDMKNSII